MTDKVLFLLGCLSMLLPISRVHAMGGSRKLPAPSFVKVEQGHLSRRGAPYHFIGTNLWSGMNLGSRGPGGDRPRLLRELNRLKKLGVTNLRILAGSEGPDTEPWRIAPALQTSPGHYDPKLLEGLDFLLAEMRKRDLTAVVVLSNFWNWSGGLGQYLRWAGEGPIPYPPPEPGGDWGRYMEYASRFFSNARAMGMYREFVRVIVSRKNSITGTWYAEDPTIMAWELANEPRGMKNDVAFNAWIEQTSTLIKSLDPHHLVTTGSEGHLTNAGLNLITNHQYASIDYATAHIWPQNWEWYDPLKPDQTFQNALDRTHEWLDYEVNLARQLGKPLVLEEFGLARDQTSFDPASSVTYRDRYYRHVFAQAQESFSEGAPLDGVNFWAWAGEASPVAPFGSWWKPGNPFLGDPPHERQGWYSVYARDRSTLQVIQKYVQRISKK